MFFRLSMTIHRPNFESRMFTLFYNNGQMRVRTDLANVQDHAYHLEIGHGEVEHAVCVGMPNHAHVANVHRPKSAMIAREVHHTIHLKAESAMNMCEHTHTHKHVSQATFSYSCSNGNNLTVFPSSKAPRTLTSRYIFADSNALHENEVDKHWI